MTLLVGISDTHAGHLGGLMNPQVVLYDEDQMGNVTEWTPNPTAIQKYLWTLHEDCRKKAVDTAKDEEIILIHAGDPTQGNRFASELVTPSAANQILIALENFRPWLTLPNVKKVRLIAGTDIHEFGESTATMLLAAALRKEFPDKDVKATKHSLLNIGGFIVDTAHHGPHPGSRSWLEGNNLRFYMRDYIIRERTHGRKAPNLILRGHYHTPQLEALDNGETFTYGAILPSFQGMTNHTRKVTGSTYSLTHGVFAFSIDRGRLRDIFRWKKTIDIRTKESL